MKILYYLDGLNRGGIEKIVVQLANYFNDKGNEVHIAYLYHDMDELKDELHSNIILHPLPFDMNKKPYLQYLKHFSYLVSLLKDIQPDILHAHNSSFSYFFLASSAKVAKLKAKYIRTIHFGGSFLERKSIFDKLRLFFDKIASAIQKPVIVTVSPFVNKIISESYRRNKNSLIINGIDLDNIINTKSTKLELGIPENSIVAIYIARICEGKNHKTLLEAWGKVVKKYPQALLVLIGDGPLKEMCIEICRKHKITDNVYITGSISNIAEYLSIANIGIFPSESEGLGLGCFEMMAAGLPVVVSDIPVFRYFIKDGNNGLFFDTHNSFDLSSKIISLLSDFKKCNEIGENSRRFAIENFELKGMFNKYDNLYKEILFN